MSYLGWTNTGILLLSPHSANQIKNSSDDDMRNEKFDAKIQAMPLHELRAKIVAYDSFVAMEGPSVDEEHTDEAEDKWMQKNAEALKKLIDESIPVPSPAVLSTERKAAVTGLDPATVLKVEHNRNQATLQEALQYCKGLDINFADFINKWLSQEQA
jgi:hypothetical protein